MDKSSGNLERSRVLSLHNASTWSKVTKTYGYAKIDDPRFNIFGFSQNENVINFGQNFTVDGLFQRFLCAMPKEVYIYRHEIKEAMTNAKSTIDLQSVLRILNEKCKENEYVITLSTAAENLYDQYYDETVDFRKDNRHLPNEISVKSKSRGMALRIAGLVCLLRCSIAEWKRNNQKEESLHDDDDSDDEITYSNSILTQQVSSQATALTTDQQLSSQATALTTDQQVSSQATALTTDASANFTAPTISKGDMEMSLEVVRSSVKISCILMRKPEKKIQSKKGSAAISTTAKCKQPIPQPENMTMDYLLSNYTHVRSLCLKSEKVQMGVITKNKMYPHGEELEKGRTPAYRFVRGLQAMGLGKYSPSSDSFKRFHPNDENCPDKKEELKKKWQKLNFE